MSRYPALVAALQAKRALFMAYCVRLDFASGPMWLWTGHGPLLTRDPSGGPDLIWQGTGVLGKVSDIDRSLAPARAPSLSLSGVDPDVAARSLAASAEVHGRPCRIYEQYFDNETSQAVDVPLTLYSGIMDTTSMLVDGPSNTCVITLKLVTLLYRRRRSAYAYLSDRSQQDLHPGDTGANQIAALVQRVTPAWPGYG